jgi:hypothetical protein
MRCGVEPVLTPPAPGVSPFREAGASAWILDGSRGRAGNRMCAEVIGTSEVASRVPLGGQTGPTLGGQWWEGVSWPQPGFYATATFTATSAPPAPAGRAAAPAPASARPPRSGPVGTPRVRDVGDVGDASAPMSTATSSTFAPHVRSRPWPRLRPQPLDPPGSQFVGVNAERSVQGRPAARGT